MKKLNLLVLSLVSVFALGIVSCNNSATPSGSSSDNASNSNSSNTTSNNQSSGSTSEELYGVVISSTPHITITSNVNVAHPGDTVTLTYDIDDGYLLKSIEVNGNAITGTSFTMPYGSALITATVELLQTDGMFIGGDAVEQLVLDPATGVYVARDVKLSKQGKVYYSINGDILSVTKIDNSKTFAPIQLPDDNKGGFKLQGGATYDFYYDPANSATPCYVKRTSVDVLPNSVSTLQDMFYGRAKSDSTMYPDGVTKVEYESTARNDDYVWELYSDYSSLATVKTYNSKNQKDKAIVYKSIDNGVYTVVDSYTESADPTKSDDTTKYSGKYDVVTALESGHKKYQITDADARVDAVSYSHDMNSIEFNIMYAYRVGFQNDISDDEYSYDIKINSVANDDGSFTTTVNSWVSVIKAGTDYSAIDANYHNEYSVVINFTKAGALLDVTYNESDYSEQQYDFTNNKFLVGGESEPTSESYMYCKYTYGEAKEGKPDVDLTPYFISELTNVSIKGSSGVEGTIARQDALNVKDSSSSSYQGDNYVSFDYLPSTALDSWQYGVVSSSNLAAINYKDNNPSSYPFDFVGIAAGKSTITIGNHTANSGIKYNYEIEVVVSATGDVRSVWFYTIYPYANDNFGANSGSVYAGTKVDVKVCATLDNSKYDQYPDITVTSSNDSLLVATYDKSTGYVTLDTTGAVGKISENTSVTLTFGANYVEDWPHPSTATITIYPVNNLLSSVVGTYDMVDDDENVLTSDVYGNIVFTDTDATTAGYKTGTLTVIVDNSNTDNAAYVGTYVVSFRYTFDENNQAIVGSVLSATKDGASYATSGEMKFEIDHATGDIGVYCLLDLGVSSNDGDWTSDQFLLLGDYDEEDDYTNTYYYDYFAARA